MVEAVQSHLQPSVDDSCLIFQRQYVREINRMSNKDFKNIYDWFADNKLSIFLEDDLKISQ